MKKIVVFLGILFSFCLLSKAQDGKITIDQAAYDKMRDNNTEMENTIKRLNDSIGNLNRNIRKLDNKRRNISTLKKNNSTLKQRNRTLDSTNRVLQKEIEELTGKKGILTKKNDTIADLKKEIVTLTTNQTTALDTYKTNLAQQETECFQKLEREKNQAKEDGRAEIRKKIENYYGQDFEKLIASTSMETVIWDSSIVRDSKAKDIINKLHTYFLIKETLTYPFNEERNFEAQDQLSTLPATPSVKKLKETVEMYSICVEELRKCLDKITTLDKKFQVNDRKDQRREKQERISGLLSEYIIEYEALNYPYLSNIIIEIMQRKQRNVDASVTDLYEKLK